MFTLKHLIRRFSRPDNRAHYVLDFWCCIFINRSLRKNSKSAHHFKGDFKAIFAKTVMLCRYTLYRLSKTDQKLKFRLKPVANMNLLNSLIWDLNFYYVLSQNFWFTKFGFKKKNIFDSSTTTKKKEKIIYIIEWPSISRIKNSIKPNGVKHILRHIYYATMQKLSKFEALYRPEIQCKSHNGNP